MAQIEATGHAVKARSESVVINKIACKTVMYELIYGLYSSLAQQLQYCRYEMPNEAFNDRLLR